MKIEAPHKRWLALVDFYRCLLYFFLESQKLTVIAQVECAREHLCLYFPTWNITVHLMVTFLKLWTFRSGKNVLPSVWRNASVSRSTLTRSTKPKTASWTMQTQNWHQKRWKKRKESLTTRKTNVSNISKKDRFYHIWKVFSLFQSNLNLDMLTRTFLPKNNYKQNKTKETKQKLALNLLKLLGWRWTLFDHFKAFFTCVFD